MKLKSVEKKITAKLEAWLESITDIKLRDKVKKNIVLSGGCIASMLLNEDVNDYDVYLRDTKVAYELAKYYCEGQDAEVWMGSKANTGKSIEGFDSSNNSKRAVALRNLVLGQVKVFLPHNDGGLAVNYVKEGSSEFNDADPLDMTKKAEEPKKYRPLFISPNAISLSEDVQVILRFTGTPEEIHATYDFVHATNYFTFESGLKVNVEAMTSLLTKHLTYQGSKYPLTSIIRTRKFVGRGWSVTAGEYLKMMFQVSELDLTNIDVLESQLIGVDVALFSALIDMLRLEKDRQPDFVISSEWLNDAIDKTFGEYDHED